MENQLIQIIFYICVILVSMLGFTVEGRGKAILMVLAIVVKIMSVFTILYAGAQLFKMAGII